MIEHGLQFSWHVSLQNGKRIYEVWDVEHNKLIYTGRGYASARKMYNRAVSERKKLEQYNREAVQP